MDKLNFLIVEDNKTSALYLKKKLLRLGYSVRDPLDNGADAINAVKEEVPDLIFMDIYLKGCMDGIETIEMIKKFADVPIIYISTCTDETILKRAKATNPYAFLFKSFSDEELQHITELCIHRHEAEKALKESDERFRAIADNDNSLICELNTEGSMLYCNTLYREVLGYTEEELLNKPSLALAHPDDLQAGMVKFHNLLTTNTPINHIWRIKSKNEQWRVFHSFASSYTTRDGDRRIIMLSNDITQKKETEDAVLNSLKLLQILIDTIPGAVLYKDFEGRILGCNKYFLEKIIGIPKEDVLNRTIFEFPDKLPKNIADAQHDIELTLLNNPGIVSDELRIMCTDNILRDFVIWKATYNDHNDVLAGTITVMFDISELKDSQRALQESEKKYRTLLNSLSDLIFTLDIKGYILFTNKLTNKFFGYSNDEIMGSNFKQYIHPDDLDSYNNFILNPDINFECRIIKKNHEIIWISVNATAIKNFENTIVGISAIARDITDQKKNAIEREKLEKQLKLSQKFEAIGTLSAGIAHEINTPIQFIGDNNYFLKEEIDKIFTLLSTYKKLLHNHGTENQNLINDIKKKEAELDLDFLKQEIPNALLQNEEGIERICGIINAMKNFSHINTDEKETININKAIENTIIICRNEWKYVADLKTHFDDSMPMISCYPGYINQAVMNIIINASHAIANIVNDGKMSKGVITLKTYYDDENIYIDISDTGGGIPDDIQHKIFDPFFTTKEVGKGTGQGLLIAYNSIVNKHHGKITFESVQDTGTTFHISLPITR